MSKLAQPLRKLTQKGVDFTWGIDEENAFNNLKA